MSEETGPQQLRESLDARSKELKDAQTELEKLRVEHRQLQASTIFEKARLSPKHAELFLKVNPDGEITSEAAQAFAKDYGLSALEGGPAPTAEGESKGKEQAPLAGMAGAGQQPGQGGGESASQTKLSQKEWSKLLVDNPDEAAQAYREGRAPTHEGNVLHERLVERGIARS